MNSSVSYYTTWNTNNKYIYVTTNLVIGWVQKHGLRSNICADDYQIYDFCRPGESALLQSHIQLQYSIAIFNCSRLDGSTIGFLRRQLTQTHDFCRPGRPIVDAVQLGAIKYGENRGSYCLCSNLKRSSISSYVFAEVDSFSVVFECSTVHSVIYQTRYHLFFSVLTVLCIYCIWTSYFISAPEVHMVLYKLSLMVNRPQTRVMMYAIRFPPFQKTAHFQKLRWPKSGPPRYYSIAGHTSTKKMLEICDVSNNVSTWRRRPTLRYSDNGRETRSATAPMMNSRRPKTVCLITAVVNVDNIYQNNTYKQNI